MRSRLLFLVFTTVLLLPLAESRAAMPEHTEQVLKQILEQKEFQPRERNPSFAQKFLERVTPYLHRAWQNLREWFDSLRPESQLDSGLPLWLQTFLNFAYELLLVAAVAIVLWVVIRLLYAILRPYLQSLKSTETLIVASHHEQPRFGVTELRELLAKNRLSELLSLLRTALRLRLEENYALAPTATDRAVSRQIPDSEKTKTLFQDTARVFEASAFANQAPNAARVSSLLNSYEALAATENEGHES